MTPHSSAELLLHVNALSVASPNVKALKGMYLLELLLWCLILLVLNYTTVYMSAKGRSCAVHFSTFIAIFVIINILKTGAFCCYFAFGIFFVHAACQLCLEIVFSYFYMTKCIKLCRYKLQLYS